MKQNQFLEYGTNDDSFSEFVEFLKVETVYLECYQNNALRFGAKFVNALDCSRLKSLTLNLGPESCCWDYNHPPPESFAKAIKYLGQIPLELFEISIMYDSLLNYIVHFDSKDSLHGKSTK